MEVKSAARVLDLLDLLSAQSGPMRLREVVTALHMPKSSAHALCQTLVTRGYALQDRDGGYRLVGSRRHGVSRPSDERLIRHAHPTMLQLCEATGETVILSTMTAQGEVRRLCKCVSRQPVRYDVDMNAPIASYCTASGRVLLAHRPPAQIEGYFAHTSLLSYTAFTRTDRDQIDALFALVRRQGYAVNDEEFVTGSTGIAAPVREGSEAVAALNLGTLSSRFHLRRDEFVAAVLAGARAIERTLEMHPANA